MLIVSRVAVSTGIDGKGIQQCKKYTERDRKYPEGARLKVNGV